VVEHSFPNPPHIRPVTPATTSPHGYTPHQTNPRLPALSPHPSRRAAAPSSLRTSPSLTALTLGLQQNDVGDQGAAALATLASTPRRVPATFPPASPKPRSRFSSLQPSIFF